MMLGMESAGSWDGVQQCTHQANPKSDFCPTNRASASGMDVLTVTP
jgi:hypothetical protein